MNFRSLFASAIVVLLTFHSANAEQIDNPFRNRPFLESSLKNLGFHNSRLVLKSRLDDGAVAKQKFKIGLSGNGLVESNAKQLAGYLLVHNLLKVNPIDRERRPYYHATIDQDAFELFATDFFVRTGNRPVINRLKGEIEIELPAAHREIDYSSIEDWSFREWREGSVEYIMVTGFYRVFVDISTTDQMRRYGDPSSALYKFKMIAERNPASNGWQFSKYRGQRSGFQSGSDFSGIVRFLNAALPEFETMFDDATQNAKQASLQKFETADFSGYTRKGDILQIQINGGKTVLVDLRPLVQRRNNESIWEPAILHCQNSTLGGYHNWILPEQPRIAELFTGTTFQDWSDFRFKAMPDGRYWGSFFKRAFEGQRTNVVQKRMYFLSSNFELEQPGRYSDDQQPRKVPYVIHQWIDMGRVLEGTFRGELQRDPHFESRNTNSIFAFCVNEDPKDNEEFLSGSVSANVLSSHRQAQKAERDVARSAERETESPRAEPQYEVVNKSDLPQVAEFGDETFNAAPVFSIFAAKVNPCLKVGANLDETVTISIAGSFDDTGRLRGSPKLVEPASPSITESAHFIAAVRALATCGPYEDLVSKNARITFGKFGVIDRAIQAPNENEVALKSEENDSIPKSEVEDGEKRNSAYADLDDKQRILVVQRELDRLGCRPGAIDGAAGKKTARALSHFVKVAGLEIAASLPYSDELLELLLSEKTSVCSAASLARKNPEMLAGKWNGTATCTKGVSKFQTTVWLQYQGRGKLAGRYESSFTDFLGNRRVQKGRTELTLSGAGFTGISFTTDGRSQRFQGEFLEGTLQMKSWFQHCRGAYAKME